MKDEKADIASYYRRYYGQIFSALTSQFGTAYVSQIEDAIQNAFYKSLKLWKANTSPKNKKNWLFIVAKNDLLNQLKQKDKMANLEVPEQKQEEALEEDLRLMLIKVLCTSSLISNRLKVLFVLKNIFGLSVSEISSCTLLSEDAIYKSLSRSKKKFALVSKKDLDTHLTLNEDEMALLQEILYAVFILGFDSFSEKNPSGYNEDLCLEAFAISKLLLEEAKDSSTYNLLALFCFHLARIPARMKDGKMLSFFEQNSDLWDKDLLNLGYKFLVKPEKINKYYLEALIVAKHMASEKMDLAHWNGIIKLYEQLITISNSPITKLNLCYCLHKAGRTEEAMILITKLDEELPTNHIHFSLLKSQIFKEDTAKSMQLLDESLNNIKQKIRREYILENLSSDLKK
ncbi:MAG: DUF6596 domain-containing protein [Bacteroidota bacterium]